ncbi:hypothetical protein FRX31_008951, partial [Thalictrum thalictroides]
MNRITVKWERVCTPVKERGMGPRRLIDVNKACLIKMAWGIHNKPGDWSNHKTSSAWPDLKQGLDLLRMHQ